MGLTRCVATGAVIIVLAVGLAAFPQSERLSLGKARQYLLELINLDRASAKLKPVALDPVATAAGQAHAEDMARYHYLSHFNQQGKPPDERYTESGGTDHVSENV